MSREPGPTIPLQVTITPMASGPSSYGAGPENFSSSGYVDPDDEDDDAPPPPRWRRHRHWD